MRQVLDQEYQQSLIRQRAEARQARFSAGGPQDTAFLARGVKNSEQQEGLPSKVAAPAKTRRDFFGRVIPNLDGSQSTGTDGRDKVTAGPIDAKKGRIWVSYNEGYSNAVKKKITLAELMRGM